MEHQAGSYDVDELNEAQRRAVTVGDGAVCVIAGPGSGKTKVISYRTAWLLREQNVSPTNIVLMTFTNKSASEMKARVANLVGSDSVGRLMMGTFHSISFRLLRQHGQRVGLPKQFSIADASSQLSIVKKIAKDRSLQDKPKSVLAAISKYKSQNKSPEDVRSELKKKTSTEYTIPDIAGIYQQYQDALSKSNNLDFDDLLVYCHRLLSKYPDVASRFEHVLVDEFQDTSQLQFDICKMLAHRGNLFAVGDEDQSIYTWRQADASCFIKLKKIYPRIESVVLEQNYRSSQAILNLSRAVIEEEKSRVQKKLWTSQGAGPMPRYLQHGTESESAYAVLKTMVEAYHNLSPDLSLDEMAILVRTNASTRAFEEACTSSRIPYRIVGGLKFFDRAEIKDIVAYLVCIHNSKDTHAFQRAIKAPRRGFGPKLLAKVDEIFLSKNTDYISAALEAAPMRAQSFVDTIKTAAALSRTDVSAAIKHIVTSIKYEEYLKKTAEDSWQDKWENVEELMNMAAQMKLDHQFDTQAESGEGRNDLIPFLEYVSLYSQADAHKDEGEVQEKLTISTIHAAKGLEWAVVAVPKVNEGTLPHARSIEEEDRNKEPLREERRLLYVAATRAKYFLLLASADQAMLNGQRSYTEPSRFLTEAVKKQMSTQAVDAQEFAETRELFAALVKTGASNAATVELMKTAQRLLASKKSHVPSWRSALFRQMADDDRESSASPSLPDGPGFGPSSALADKLKDEAPAHWLKKELPASNGFCSARSVLQRTPVPQPKRVKPSDLFKKSADFLSSSSTSAAAKRPYALAKRNTASSAISSMFVPASKMRKSSSAPLPKREMTVPIPKSEVVPVAEPVSSTKVVSDASKQTQSKIALAKQPVISTMLHNATTTKRRRALKKKLPSRDVEPMSAKMKRWISGLQCEKNTTAIQPAQPKSSDVIIISDDDPA